MYQGELARAGYGTITTEIREAPEFYFAEDYHQQYLAKNPDGYDCHTATGVACPIGVGVTPSSSPQRAVLGRRIRASPVGQETTTADACGSRHPHATSCDLARLIPGWLIR